MKIATFDAPDGGQSPGVLLDDDERVVDLRVLHRTLDGQASSASAFESVQALIEGGEAAMALLRNLVARADSSGLDAGVHELTEVKLRAAIPRPVC